MTTDSDNTGVHFTPWSIGIVGSSGSGKTTLIEQLVPLLRAEGAGVGVLKHARAGVELDRPGKDSHRAQAAGATEVMLATGAQWALIGVPDRPAAEPGLEELLQRFSASRINLVLVEGFAHAAHEKIEVFRPEHGRPPSCWPHDPRVVAVASNSAVLAAPAILLDLDHPHRIAEFILERRSAARDRARLPLRGAAR